MSSLRDEEKRQQLESEEVFDEHTHEFDIYSQALDCYICSICGAPENGDE